MAHLEDDIRPDLWPEPKATGNAHFLAAFIAGRLDTDSFWKTIELGNPLILEHRDNSNRYRVIVEQISGQE